MLRCFTLTDRRASLLSSYGEIGVRLIAREYGTLALVQTLLCLLVLSEDQIFIPCTSVKLSVVSFV